MSFNIKINVTIPKKLFSDVKVREAIEKKMRKEINPDILDEFHSVTDKFEISPINFKDTVVSTSSAITGRVFADGNSNATEVFRILSLGIDHEYKIQPKKQGGMLKYQEGYTPATKPGSLLVGKAKRFGRSWTTTLVTHPKMEPRAYDKLIAEKYEKSGKFNKHIQDAVNEAFADSNFAL